MKTRLHLFSALLLSFFFVIPSSALATSYGLNDVTLLFPLPAPQSIPDMIAPGEVGEKGVLLPQEIYQRFPALDNRFDAVSLYRNNFKVIGARIDPCFAEGASTVCRRQIRLVWQPLIENDGKTITLDAAVHTFYEFSETEWKEVLRDWSGVVKGNLTEPLQVNPSMKREGIDGPTFARVRKIISKYCGDKSIVRMTGMRVSAARMWTFLGFDKTGNTWTRMAIPRTNSTIQSFILFSDFDVERDEFVGSLSPAPADSNLLVEFVTNSRAFKIKKTPSEIKSLMDENFRFENPKLNNPGTVDCVSCHMTQTITLWGQRNYPSWDWRKGFGDSRFQSSMNLSNTSVNPGNTNRVRAFGYFDNEPILSQRVINESAAIATALVQASKR